MPDARIREHRGFAIMFDISLLRCFVTVAEEMHFGRAAVRMNMSQGPFSRQIQIFERMLAVKLLERTSRSVKLTPAGQSFLPEARHILQLLENATVLAKRVALGKSGSLKIGFTAMAAFGILPLLVAACRGNFPHAELILQEASSADQLRKLHSFRDRHRDPSAAAGTNCVAVFLLLDGISYCSTSGFASIVSEIENQPPRLGREPFISYLPYEAYYFCTSVGDLLSTAGVMPTYVQQLTHVHSVMALVHAGMGVSIVPESARLFNFSDVVLRPVEDPQPRPLELFMAWRTDNLNPLVPQMVELAASRRRFDRPI